MERRNKEAGKRVEMSDPGDGHPEVRTWKKYIMDFGDVTDHGEVQLNVRDLPGIPLRECQW